MKKYTPGPWHAMGPLVRNSLGEQLCDCRDFWHEQAVLGKSSEEYIAEADQNAILMAAAPEMFEALQKIANDVVGSSGKIARDIISKIEERDK